MTNPRFIQIAKKWKNKNLPAKRPKPVQQKTNKLERNAEGRPIIELTYLERTAVHAPTQEDYRTLMRVYESGNWMWGDGKLPTSNDYWETYKGESCIDVGKSYLNNDIERFCFGSKGSYEGNECTIISTQEFYDGQKITLEMIEEINEYFDNLGDKK